MAVFSDTTGGVGEDKGLVGTLFSGAGGPARGAAGRFFARSLKKRQNPASDTSAKSPAIHHCY
jgi:hypothetical protein